MPGRPAWAPDYRPGGPPTSKQRPVGGSALLGVYRPSWQGSVAVWVGGQANPEGQRAGQRSPRKTPRSRLGLGFHSSSWVVCTVVPACGGRSEAFPCQRCPGPYNRRLGAWPALSARPGAKREAADRMAQRRFLVTAALPYSNGRLHVGHIAGAYLPADTYVRYLRATGAQVRFICGSDDNGVAALTHWTCVWGSPGKPQAVARCDRGCCPDR